MIEQVGPHGLVERVSEQGRKARDILGDGLAQPHPELFAVDVDLVFGAERGARPRRAQSATSTLATTLSTCTRTTISGGTALRRP